MVFSIALAIIEFASLLSSPYSWLDKPRFGWLANAAFSYSVFYYALAGFVCGALTGAILFWILGSRGRLISVRWGWLPVSIVGFLVLFLAGGKVLNTWVMPPKGNLNFYIWNVLFSAGSLLFSMTVGVIVRAAAGVSSPRPKPKVKRLVRGAALTLAVLGLYLAASIGLVAWKGARAEEEAPDQAVAEAERPNVLLVVVSTARADHLSCYGYDRETTPNVDRWMAEQGALFENAVAQAPFAGSSRASIITGRYPRSHGVRAHPRALSYDEVTLAEVFSSQGYATACFGAGAWEDPRYGYHQGHDAFQAITTSYDLDEVWPLATTFTLYLNRIMPWYTTPKEREDLLAAGPAVEMARSWMQGKHDEGRPFLMQLELNEPHFSYEPPPPFDAAFGPTQKGTDLVEEIKNAAGNAGAYKYEYENLGKDPAALEQAVALYDGEIAYVDDALGRLFEGMSAGGYLESTVIILTSDHGENFGEHGVHFRHSLLYESSIAVPLLVRYPKEVRPGTRVSAPVESVDIYPAALELAGLRGWGNPIDGRSLLKTMEADSGKAFVFSESRFYDPSFARYENYRISVSGVDGKWTCVRHGDLKLIRAPTLSGVEWELYDLADDPGETVNLSGEHPMEELLREALRRWMAGQPLPEAPPTERGEGAR